MDNKLTRKKPNRLLISRNNYYNQGGFWSNPFSGQNGMDVKNSVTQAAGTAIGQIGGGLIGGGLQSGAGNMLQGLSGIASAIPGPWGAVASAGLGLLSGVTNRAFGSKLNTENIAKVESNISNLKNFQSNASDFDTLSNNWANAVMGMTFNDSFIGKDGWLSSNAKNKATDLRNQISAGNTWVQNTLKNNAQNISNTQMQNLLANYAAYGGHLFDIGGPITAFYNGKKDTNSYVGPVTRAMQKKGKKVAKKVVRKGGFGGGRTGGGGASNKPSTVTDYKTVNDTTIVPIVQTFNDAFAKARNKGLSIFEFNGNLYNTKMGTDPNNQDAGNRRVMPLGMDTIIDTIKVPYTRNSWALGGDLMTHGADFDTGITLIGNGGTHEANPYEGVPMGVDQEGTPNLVEEGEVIFNDYVFSKRLKVPQQVKNKYKLRSKKPLSFADAALQMSKESEERPNDPISRNGLEDSMMKLMMAQEQVREKQIGRQYAEGGKLGRKYGGPGNYPQQLMLNDGSIVTGDLNDTSWMNGFDFSFDPTKTDFYKDNIAPLAGPINPETTMASIGDSTAYPSTSAIPTTTAQQYGKSKTKTSGDRSNGLAPTWMRYIPAFASGAMAITDAMGLTNKPDYSEAEALLEASRGAGTYQPVQFNPVGNYLTYNPFDLDFAINQANAESGAARRAIMNNSGGNRAQAMSAILAADNNALNQLGILRRGAAEDNLKQRQAVESFNRATNQFNSEGFFKADAANQAALAQSRDFQLKGIMAASELRQKERQQATAARSANLSNFINSLGDIGRENFSRNMIVSDPSKYYSIGANGEITYKKSFDDLSEAEQDYIRGHASRKSQGKKSGSKKAKGGYLTIKRK